MKTVIEINGLGKKYQIRKAEPYLALRDAITDTFKNIFRKRGESKRDFWALQDINLKIEKGERIGIIGKNGAGKSTLLKILSRITWPTTGEAIIRGRLASLLEVGTGFHPELTGRENIYLNGSILGLKKSEIDRQFDAIVDFSGVETFLDTPLKNYSSGMQLRLAFAVAAHLEPEVLLIDEVLAAGDMEFQKKCLGKMEEVSKQHGRTILFVSHNLQAVSSFCTGAVFIDTGKIRSIGSAENIITEYTKLFQSNKTKEYIATADKLTKSIFIKQASLQNSYGQPEENFSINDDIFIETLIEKKTNDISFLFRIAVHDTKDQRVVLDQHNINCPENPCLLKCRIKISSALLAPNDYTLILALIKQGIGILDNQRNILPFNIIKSNTRFENIDFDYGYINQSFDWNIQIFSSPATQ
jgi:lipopolysaccharide transport system ATP-binding protein